MRPADVFTMLEDKDLILLAEMYPKELIDICTMLALDLQKEKEDNLKLN
jgi:hypothetical protein